MVSRAAHGASIIAIVVALVAMPNAGRSAAEIVVAADGSGTYRSISEAVGAAQDGDTIVVLPGTYSGQLDIAASITIEGRGARRDIRIEAPEPRRNGLRGTITLRDSDATISGVTVGRSRRGSASIVATGGSPTLRDIAASSVHLIAPVAATVAGSSVGGEIQLEGGSALIRENEAGRVELRAAVDAIVEGNQLGSIRLDGSSLTARGNHVTGAAGGPIGIEVSDRAVGATVDGNTVSRKGAGILLRGAGPTIVHGNEVTGSSAGLIVGNPNAVITANRICDNRRDVVSIDGVEPDLDGNEICVPAGQSPIDPALEPDEDGFTYEVVAPDVRRVLSDGAGHYPSAPYVVEARDMDQLAVDEAGSVIVWSTTHGIDNELAGDQQLWVLGTEGALRGGRESRAWDDSRVWAVAERAAREQGMGTIARRGRVAASRDGKAWAIIETPTGSRMARFDGTSWTIFAQPPGTRQERIREGRIAPDGGLWSRADRGGGVTRFDGRTTDRYLSGYEVNSIAITPDGRVWVAVEHRGGAGAIFVIEHDAGGTIPKPAHDPDLVADFPAELGGRPLDVDSISGGEWLASFDPFDHDGSTVRRLITVFVGASGKALDDLSLGFASLVPSPGNHATITAVRLAGSDAEPMTDAVIALLLGGIRQPVTTEVEISGKRILRVTDARIPGAYPHYAYAAGDTVWIVDAEEPLLSEVFAALP